MSQAYMTQDGQEFHFGWAPDEKHRDEFVQKLAHPTFFSAVPELKGYGEGKDVFFWDIEEQVAGKRLPAWNQSSLGSCFPAGTLIRMADNTYKPIETIRLNDVVVTAEGNTGKVTHLFTRQETNALVNIKLWGHNTLRLTEEHPILTDRGYVKAGDLLVNDYVAMPRYTANTHSIISTTSYIESLGSRVASSTKRKIPGKTEVITTTNPVVDVIRLNKNTGTIFGLFLAEGNTDKSKVVWTFGSHEEHTLVKDLITILKEEWNVDAHTQIRAAHNTIKVVVYGTLWARLFEALCATGSGNKRLHSDLAGGPDEFLEALLQGWLSGDGYATRRKEKDLGTTVSKSLAMSMLGILQHLGKRAGLKVSYPGKSKKDGIERKPRYDVYARSEEDNYRVTLDDKYVWRKVNTIVYEKFYGTVYNMEVEGDNSYVAEGIGVHNCVSHGGGRAAQDLLFIQIAAGWREVFEGHQVAREPIYGGSRCNVGGQYGSYTDGSSGSWCAAWMADKGGVVVYGPNGLDGDYDIKRCRDWGAKGCPKEFVIKANAHKLHTTMITTPEEARDALAALKPINICGLISRTMKRQKNGFCPKVGNGWAHSQELCGTCVVKGNRPAICYRNSWGDYMGSDNNRVVLESGKEITLPDGVYLADLEEIASDLRQQDTFAYSGAEGWKAVVLPWLI